VTRKHVRLCTECVVTHALLCHPEQEYNMMGRNREGDAHAHHLGSSGAPSCDLGASSQGDVIH
jgi:hypothetical protein